MTNNIKYDSQKISEIASLLKQQSDKVSLIHDLFENTNDDLQRVWLGKASHEFLMKSQLMQERVDLVVKGLQDLSTNLYQVAGRYEQGTSQVEGEVDSLKTEGVFR
jgi:WXG100 family type VII secretion target